MNFQHLFAADSGTSIGNVSEIELSVASAQMALDVKQMEVESNSIDASLSKLSEIENLTCVMSSVGRPKTEAEQMLMHFSTLALFGGEVKFEDITEGYSIESFASEEDAFEYSLESLKRRAQSIWNYIKEQAKRVWAFIERFFYNLFGAIPNMRKKAEDLRKRVASASGKSKEESKMEVDANTMASLADADGKARTQAAAIIKDLESSADLISNGEKFYYNKLEKLGKGIDDGLNGASPEAADYLATINSNVSSSEAYQSIVGDKLFGQVKLVNIGGTDKRFSGRSAHKLPLFAGKTIFRSVLSNSAQGDNQTELGKAENIRGVRVEVRETTPDIKKLQASSIDVWDLTDCEKLAEAIDRFCDAAESVQRGAEKGSINKIRDKLEKSGDKFGKALESARKRTGDDSLSAEQLSTARSALNYVKFFGDLTSKPLPSIIALYMAGFNSALSVANKSISMYK